MICGIFEKNLAMFLILFISKRKVAAAFAARQQSWLTMGDPSFDPQPPKHRSNWRHTLNELSPQCLSAHARTAEAVPAALRRECNGRACVFCLRSLPAPAFSHSRGSEGGAGLRARPKCREPGKDGGRAHAGRLQSESAML